MLLSFFARTCLLPNVCWMCNADEFILILGALLISNWHCSDGRASFRGMYSSPTHSSSSGSVMTTSASPSASTSRDLLGSAF